MLSLPYDVIGAHFILVLIDFMNVTNPPNSQITNNGMNVTNEATHLKEQTSIPHYIEVELPSFLF